MKDLRTQLRDADPVVREQGRSHQDVARMRRHVLSAERETTTRRSAIPLALAAALLLTCIGGVLLTRASVSQTSSTITAPAAEQHVRQLQFSAPGGTRVIWTFNPNLQVR
jgi:hypothetical protein